MTQPATGLHTAAMASPHVTIELLRRRVEQLNAVEAVAWVAVWADPDTQLMEIHGPFPDEDAAIEWAATIDATMNADRQPGEFPHRTLVVPVLPPFVT